MSNWLVLRAEEQDGNRGDRLIGLMLSEGRLPLVVSFGGPHYVGDLSINDVVEDRDADIPRVTRTSHYVLNGAQLASLKAVGEIRVGKIAFRLCRGL